MPIITINILNCFFSPIYPIIFIFNKLASILKKGDIFLVKASRGIAAERVIKILEERL